MSIYVEILVRAPMDALWAHTQTPALHEHWDLRFSRIDYLPKAHETEPQRFRYATRIGFGLEISGEGETLGQRDSTDGSRSSALRFSSAEPLSIIREGSGYWKYVPTPEGIRFLTSYDYRTRFGHAGALFDRFIFRPLIGWATAWSFDRLRLWLEQRVDPAQAMRLTLVHTIARIVLVAAFVSGAVAKTAVTIFLLELAFTAALLVDWHRRWPLVICFVFTVVANPASLSLVVASLAGIDLLVIGSVPSAAGCLRRPGGNT